MDALTDLWAQYSGFLLEDSTLIPGILGTLAAVLILGYFGLPFFLWGAVALVALAGFGAPLWFRSSS
jgi:hypothetical protein